MDPRDKPWQAPGLVPRNETLSVGPAASRVLPREVVLEALRSAAVCTELAANPTHPGHEVAIVQASFPTWVSHNGGLVGRMAVSLSVQR